LRLTIILLLSLAWLGSAACSREADQAKPELAFVTEELPVVIGGRNAVRLRRADPGPENRLHFVSADILPGRAMNVLRIQAHVPGRGIVDVIASPSIEEAARRMDGGPEDFNGNQSFKTGTTILLPFANRIRGKWIEAERAIESIIGGRPVRLPANWKGPNPASEPHSIHGLILASAMDSVEHTGGADSARMSGQLSAGDFGGRWLSKTDIDVEAVLRENVFTFRVVAKNVGGEVLPMGIGWHPYLSVPGGNRKQARLHIPARRRLAAANYDDVFPTGEVVDVAGTGYDFSIQGGAALDDLFLDDCFVDLEKDEQGHVSAEVIDPAAGYGVRLTGLVPEISAFMVYTPVDAAFVSVEPQFNWTDPYSSIWRGRNTGMVELEPGASTTFAVQIELFKP